MVSLHSADFFYDHLASGEVAVGVYADQECAEGGDEGDREFSKNVVYGK